MLVTFKILQKHQSNIKKVNINLKYIVFSTKIHLIGQNVLKIVKNTVFSFLQNFKVLLLFDYTFQM